MAGLKFATGLTASVGPGTSQGATSPTEAAWGPGVGSSVAQPSAGRSLSPGHPAGLQWWLGVGGIVVLALLRHSLPG